MNVIVFSKDRACQLDAFMSSCEYHFPGIRDCNATVIYRFTTDEYFKGYEVCKINHPKWSWIEEAPGDFKNCVIRAIDVNHKYTVFFVDDQIWTAPFSKADREMKCFAVTDQQMCLSLRLHPKITYGYAMNVKMSSPRFYHKWVWRWTGTKADFAYPMSVDGHIFKTKDALPLLLSMDYRNPNNLEGNWAKHPLPNKFLMGCYEAPRVINIPLNKVNEECNNRSMNQSPEQLNKQYLNGLRIDWMRLKGYVGSSVHIEMELPVIGQGKPVEAVPAREKKEVPELPKVRNGNAKKGYEISIVTGTLNRRVLLPMLIKNTVLASKKIELILVDGGSEDGTQEYVKSLGSKQITLIEIGKRSHYSHYMNEGILKASSDLICIWNDDVLLESSWENVLSTIMPEIDVYLFSWKNNRLKDWTVYYNPPVEVVMNYGIYRRSVFEKVGMFSGAYQYYRADGDMAYRAWAFGHAVLPCRNIHVRELDVEKKAGACTDADDEAYDVMRAMYRCGTIPDDIEKLAQR